MSAAETTGEFEQRVADVLITHPKTLPVDATIGDVREFFEDQHVHMALLTANGQLVGTLLRTDLEGRHPLDAALAAASLSGRTIEACRAVASAYALLTSTEGRRLAVVDHGGRLEGLLCLKKDRRGFCSDDDVRSRARERQQQSAGA